MSQRILNYLTTNAFGRQRAIKAQRLAEAFGLTLREINAIIHDLRQSGSIIGSAKGVPQGYYIPADNEEARVCIRGYESEAYNMVRIIQRWRRAISRQINQGEQLEWF